MPPTIGTLFKTVFIGGTTAGGTCWAGWAGAEIGEEVGVVLLELTVVELPKKFFDVRHK